MIVLVIIVIFSSIKINTPNSLSGDKPTTTQAHTFAHSEIACTINSVTSPCFR